MTIKKNIGTFRDGSVESLRRSTSTRKFADSVKLTTDGLDTRVSSLESYSPANADKWAGTPPTTLAEAIDRIAETFGAPIPEIG